MPPEEPHSSYSSDQSNGPGFFDRLRGVQIQRPDDRWLAGVCAGVGRWLGIDPAIVRVGTVLLAFLGGLGIGLYLLGWLLLPETSRAPHLERGIRGGEAGSIVLLIVTGVVLLGGTPIWDVWGGGAGFWAGLWWMGWMAAIAGVIYLVIRWARDNPKGNPPSAGPPPPEAHTHYATPSPPAPTAAAPDAASAAPPHTPSSGGVAPGAAPPHTPFAGPAAPGATPPSPAAPKQRRRRGPGASLALLALGLSVMTCGILWWADVPGAGIALGWAGALSVLGLIILILGIAGRRSGFVGFLAGVALLGTLVLQPLPGGAPTTGSAGDEAWRPESVADLTDSEQIYQHGYGRATLDLTDFDPSTLNGQESTLEAGVGFGQLLVLVPDDLTVAIEGEAGYGAINYADNLTSLPSEFSSTAGVSVRDSVVAGTGPTDLTLDLAVGAGSIDIKKGQ